MGLYTEQGVVARRDATPDELINEIREAATARHTALLADPPTDGSAKPERIFGGIPWDWQTLLRNRPLDVWMHEQDVRRAVGRPGDLDTARGAAHRRLPRREPRLRARQAGRRADRHHAWCSRWTAARRAAFEVNDDGPRRAAARAPGRPDGPAAHGPRDVHRARRRPARRRARRVAIEGDEALGRRLARPARDHAVSGAADAWSPADIPDQAGRTVVVTGTTVGGLGHHTALELARRGARVVLAGRTRQRLDETGGRSATRCPTPSSSSWSSTSPTWRRYAARPAEAAGARPDRRAGQQRRRHGHRRTSRTADGLELQMATNHFGPFLLTGLLLPQLVASKAATVVDGLLADAPGRAAGAPRRPARHASGRYAKWPVYGAVQAGQPALHLRARPPGPPGRAAGQGARRAPRLLRHPPGRQRAFGRSSGGPASILDAAIRAVAQPAAEGAWPTLMAATADLPGVDVLRAGRSGRDARRARRSSPARRLAHDEDAQRRLWELSEETTGIRYP